MALECFSFIVPVTIPQAVLLSVQRTVGCYGYPILVRIIWNSIMCCVVIYSAAILASIADAMTFLILFAKPWIGPLNYVAALLPK